MSFIPARLATITPYLICRDAHDAIGWYRDAFGAELVGEIYPMSDTDDRVGHAELRIGESTIFLSDEWPEGERLRAGDHRSLDDRVRALRRPTSTGPSTTRSALGATVGPPGGRPVPRRPRRAGCATRSATAGTSPPRCPIPTRGRRPGRPFRAEDLFDEIGYYVLGRADLDRAKAFYGSVFGWRFAEENPTPDGFRGAHVESSKVPFGLADDPGIRRGSRTSGSPICAATLDRIRAAGGEVLERAGLRERRQRPLPRRPGRRVRPVPAQRGVLTGGGQTGGDAAGRAAADDLGPPGSRGRGRRRGRRDRRRPGAGHDPRRVPARACSRCGWTAGAARSGGGHRIRAGSSRSTACT